MTKQSKQAEEQYLIVISYDAFSDQDFTLACKKPHLAKLVERGSYTTNVQSVYPTLTYVIHASYVTGMYPKNHGVYHNNPLQPFEPEKDQAWFWYRNMIHAPTVYEAVKEQGMTTAALLWPVTGKADIDYNIPEIRAIKKENQALKILKNGSAWFSLMMELKYGRERNGIAQPELDHFTTKCAVDTIVNKKPNLLLIHLIDLDDAKHAQGTSGPHIEQVIERMDQRIGQIVEAVERAGIMEQTTFMIIGDHSQLNVRYKIHLNAIFYEHGLIYEEQGQMKWRAYVQGAGGSAYVHIRQGDTWAEAKVIEIIDQLKQQRKYGIEHFYSSEQLHKQHVDPSIRYMIEGYEGYCFEDDIHLPVIVDLDAYGMKFATHGYSPDKENYQSAMVVAGPHIKQNYKFDSMNVIDVAPTIARILNVPFGPCDGKCLDQIFEPHD